MKIEPFVNKDIEKNSYNSIFKSNFLFGGIKVVEVLVQIIRIKIIAIFLGPNGVGIQTIFQSTLASINQFSSLGIFQSAVRDISYAYQNNDHLKLNKTLTVVHKLVWIIALLGTGICVIGSGIISKISFGNYNYTGQFALLSLALLFWALSSENITIMQGRRQLKDLAISSLIGASISLIITLPIYYFIGINGIALSLVIGYFSIYIVNRIFVKREAIKYITIPFTEVIKEGRDTVKLGMILMFSNVLMTLFTFLTNAFISNHGGIEDVGFFQSAFTITYGNLVVLVAIMTTDYYPRLAAVYKSNPKVNMIVNQQTELLLVVIAPLTAFLLLFAPFMVKILYSAKFLCITPTLRLMALALIFRVIWYALSYIILARGDKKTYFIYDALIGNGLNFMCNIGAYYFFGLEGLGISFVAGSFLMVLLLGYITKCKYQFKYTTSVKWLIFSFAILELLIYIFITYLDKNLAICLCTFIIIIILIISCFKLFRNVSFLEKIKIQLFNRE